MNLFDTFILCIVILWLFVGSLFDFKKREVPDYLNFSLIFVGFFSRLIYSIVIAGYTVFVYGIFGFLLTLIFGAIMSYCKQWGDGDSKILIGVGTCLGFSLNFTFFDFNSWPILLYFFLNSMIAGAIYGLVWTIGLCAIHFKDFLKTLAKLDKKFLYLPILSTLAFIIINLFFIKNPLFSLTVIGLCIGIYVLIFIKIVEDSCMYKKVNVLDLVPGDWVVETVKFKDKVICSKKDRCLDEEQIKLLKKYKIKSVLVKEGIPFVPSFFFGILLSLIFGNILRFLF